MKIIRLSACEIFTSDGLPTVACEIELEDGKRVMSSVPIGIASSKYEAESLADGGDRLWGLGQHGVVQTIENSLAAEFIGKTPQAVEADLKMIDMDGTSSKSKLGANAILAVSMAMYRAHAYVEGLELYELLGHALQAESVSLPFPFFNMVEGGKHAPNNLTIQEFLVVPVETASFRESLEVGSLIYHEFGKLLQSKGHHSTVGREGGYVPFGLSDKEVLDLILEVLVYVKQVYGFTALIALDVAASTFYDDQTHQYKWCGEHILAEELVKEYEVLLEQYPICLIEDGMAEDDWEGWKVLQQQLHSKVQLIGDDLFVTHPERIAQGIESGVVSGSIIKPDQAGTITEALQAVRLCKEYDLLTFVSHRSGETCDAFIADFSVGISAGQIKAGGFSRGERMAKYNRLARIEDELLAREKSE